MWYFGGFLPTPQVTVNFSVTTIHRLYKSLSNWILKIAAPQYDVENDQSFLCGPGLSKTSFSVIRCKREAWQILSQTMIFVTVLSQCCYSLITTGVLSQPYCLIIFSSLLSQGCCHRLLITVGRLRFFIFCIFNVSFLSFFSAFFPLRFLILWGK